MSKHPEIKTYLEQCALEEDDIGNATINAALEFELPLSAILDIMDEMLKKGDMELYEYDEDDIIAIGYCGNIFELFKFNRYNVFLNMSYLKI